MTRYTATLYYRVMEDPMCIHTIEEFLDRRPEFSRESIERALEPLQKAFPNIPKDRLGEAAVLGAATADENSWDMHEDDVMHYWELFCKRTIRDVSQECPHDDPVQICGWVMDRMDSLSLMLMEALTRRGGLELSSRMLLEACQLAQWASEIMISASVDDTIN